MLRLALFALVFAFLTACGSDPPTRGDAGTGADTSSFDVPAADVSVTDGPRGDALNDAGRPRPGAANILPCMADRDCDDGLPCTQETCEARVSGERFCRYEAQPSRCQAGETCDLRAGCRPGRVCTGDMDCADMDPCTVMERCDTAARVCLYSSVFDGDGDGYAAPACGGTDCRDDDMQAYLGARELCNGRDDNCDGRADEGIDLMTDRENCGMCGQACVPGQTCAGGMCLCPAGQSVCANVCRDGDCRNGCYVLNTMTDRMNCGSCGNVCPATYVCVAGTCNCQADLMTDRMNCGRCERTCAVGATCVRGECTCPGSLTVCSNACIDVMTNDGNCGGCGARCRPGESCRSGMCFPL